MQLIPQITTVHYNRVISSSVILLDISQFWVDTTHTV